MTTTDKYCPGCRQTWPRVAFWRDKTRPDGRSRLCRNCQAVRMAKYWREVYYPRHRERLIERATEYRKKHAYVKSPVKVGRAATVCYDPSLSVRTPTS